MGAASKYSTGAAENQLIDFICLNQNQTPNNVDKKIFFSCCSTGIGQKRTSDKAGGDQEPPQKKQRNSEEHPAEPGMPNNVTKSQEKLWQEIVKSYKK